jgi:prolyl oligopeptidase PreP (S9A serine peptidase family)
MVASLLLEAQPKGLADEVFYWENTEGGHGGAADNKQRAHMWALTFEFLARSLGLPPNRATTQATAATTGGAAEK